MKRCVRCGGSLVREYDEPLTCISCGFEADAGLMPSPYEMMREEIERNAERLRVPTPKDREPRAV